MHHNRINIAELVRRGQAMARAAQGSTPEGAAPWQGREASDDAASDLRDVAAFGRNPGDLRMRVFLPDQLPRRSPLLVALHGCTQTAAGFNRGCGWSDLARRHGFALLMPEQRRSNNPNRCFHWFEPGDTARGAGETGSIRSMVAHLLAEGVADPARVFIAGLSAGGALAATMLATHPELFGAGAIFAGLPHGVARSMPEAFEAMATGRPDSAAARAAAVRSAAPEQARHGGPGPRVAIWHGETDTTVNPVNAQELVKQWVTLHGLDPAAPSAIESLGPGKAGHRRVWRDAAGRAVVELNLVAGLGHGVPIRPGPAPQGGGTAMPFILDVGIPGPSHALAFFGLAPAPTGPTERARSMERMIFVDTRGEARIADGGGPRREPPEAELPRGRPDPGAVIRTALRSAGLLRTP